MGVRESSAPAQRAPALSVRSVSPGPDARRRWLIAAPLAWSVGCASTRVTPVRAGEPVELVYADSLAVGQASIDNLALPSNTKTGVGAGATVGALSGLGCGPLAFLCVPVGLLVGGITGGVGGAAVGLTGSLPNEKALALRNRLVAVHSATPLLAELRTQVDQRAARVWDVKTRPAAQRLVVELSALELSSTRDEEIGLTLTASTRLERLGPAGTSPVSEKAFTTSAPPTPIGIWLDERSDYVESLFRTSAQQLAAQIVAEFSRS